MAAFDVTIVINAHREGLIAAPSLISASRAKMVAEKNGYKVETFVVQDRADDLTKEVIGEWATPDVRILDVDNGDPGCSRNDAVFAASGEWVAFLDADDLWDEHWLNEALNAARRDRREIVWHPEVSLYFGAESRIFRSIDMESDEFELSSLLVGNYWTVLCLARQSLLLEVPHPATDIQKKIGHEDWGWNLQAMERGAIHKIVPGTGHGIRVKESGSVMRAATSAGVIPKPSNVFRKLLEDKERSLTAARASRGS